MTTATNALRNDLIGEIAHLLNNNRSGSIVSDIGTFSNIIVVRHSETLQSVCIAGEKELINPSLHVVLNNTLLALGYRLTH
jgi:hypothetical protein